MAYLRFVTPQRDSDSGVSTGVFQAAHELLDSGELGETELILVREALDWFNANLPRPERFNRTTSKGHYRRRAAGIAWFRDTATECLMRMHALKAVLDAHGRPVSIRRGWRRTGRPDGRAGRLT